MHLKPVLEALVCTATRVFLFAFSIRSFRMQNFEVDENWEGGKKFWDRYVLDRDGNETSTKMGPPSSVHFVSGQPLLMPLSTYCTFKLLLILTSPSLPLYDSLGGCWK